MEALPYPTGKEAESMMNMKSIRVFFILPICLLIMNALQELAIYKLERTVMDKFLFTGALLLMTAAGFTLVGNIVSPWIESIIEGFHKGSKRKAGRLGVLMFYSATIVGLYILYYCIYVRGPESLIPNL